MTYLHNDPTQFAAQTLVGFIAAYPDRVQAVPGGIVRATASPAGEVAIVIGGGSGHYPAFAGLVGPGLAHGAALGNVFASPSAEHVYQVAKAANNGGGILLTYGNYAGDVLNFDQAQERLRAEGIPCRTVAVCDDISSASPAERDKRRGVAGDLAVFKVAAHAAEQGATLDEVWAAAAHANDRTRTLGIAFTGCTLPGAERPLFTIPAGRMGVGVGLHGEPGLREEDIGSAEDIAQLLVRDVLAEVPEGADTRVAVITNGLGSVKYEELFVLYGTIDRLLRAAGLRVIQPEVGEICTSFEMAGVSLTLVWLDDALEQAWTAPADSPAYRKGSATVRPLRDMHAVSVHDSGEQTSASQESQELAQLAARAVAAVSQRIDEKVVDLGRLDAIAGDGDHGIGMQRGASAARAASAHAAQEGAGVGTVLTQAADAWAGAAGGASGAIWGVILRTLGNAIGDQDAPSAVQLGEAAVAAGSEVTRFGKAEVGDKTLVDALVPFAAALLVAAEGGAPLHEAWAGASQVAAQAAQDTAQLLPRIGRARPHAEKALGTPDPGAISFAHIVDAVASTLRDQEEVHS